jgi:hypothetical protein
MKKLETIQNDISKKEIIEKFDIIQNTVKNIQNNVVDKETMRKLSDENKKSVFMSYAGLSIAYLGIGLTLLFAFIKITSIQYSITFGVFFGGSIVLAYLAYAKRKE